MSLSSNKGTIIWTIQKGSNASAVINKSDGWAMYDEIVMDFKLSKDLQAGRILRLQVGSGITIEGNALSISLGYEQTAMLRSGQLYADIKLRTGNTVIKPIPFAIHVQETVTRL